MRRLALTTVAAAALTATAAAVPAPVAPELRRPLARLQGVTTLPILLPSVFPHPPLRGRTLTTTISTTARSWKILLNTCRGGGFAESCDLGSIAAERGGSLPTQFPKAALADGVAGRYFRPSGCGDACDRTVIWWRRYGLLYRIELRDSARTKPDPRALIVSVANSAITAGPR